MAGLSFPKPAPRAIDRAQRKRDDDTAYKRASRLARQRDGGRCRICGTYQMLEAHHLVARSRVGSKVRHAVSNLVTLCRFHHDEVTRHVMKLEPIDDSGADGKLRVLRYADEQRGYVVAMEAA